MVLSLRLPINIKQKNYYNSISIYVYSVPFNVVYLIDSGLVYYNFCGHSKGGRVRIIADERGYYSGNAKCGSGLQREVASPKLLSTQYLEIDSYGLQIDQQRTDGDTANGERDGGRKRLNSER